MSNEDATKKGMSEKTVFRILFDRENSQAFGKSCKESQDDKSNVKRVRFVNWNVSLVNYQFASVRRYLIKINFKYKCVSKKFILLEHQTLKIVKVVRK